MPKHRSFPLHILVFLGPAVLIYTAFMIYPLVDSLWLSLNNRGPTGGPHFVGAENYQALFSQDARPRTRLGVI
jgi:raffinose/stachyose/melibiose transport system permease protein